MDGELCYCFVYSHNQVSKFHNHMDRLRWPLHILCLKKGEGSITGSVFAVYAATEACCIALILLCFALV